MAALHFSQRVHSYVQMNAPPSTDSVAPHFSQLVRISRVIGSCERLTDGAKAAGDSPAGARVVDDSPCPPRRKHSASLEAITARQLPALVGQPTSRRCLAVRPSPGVVPTVGSRAAWRGGVPQSRRALPARSSAVSTDRVRRGGREHLPGPGCARSSPLSRNSGRTARLPAVTTGPAALIQHSPGGSLRRRLPTPGFRASSGCLTFDGSCYADSLRCTCAYACVVDEVSSWPPNGSRLAAGRSRDPIGSDR